MGHQPEVRSPITRIRTIALLLLVLIAFDPILLHDAARAQVPPCPTGNTVTVAVTPGQSVGTLANPDASVQQTYQQSMIPVGSTGDLIFTITLTAKCDGIRIYVPPEFTGFTRLMANGFYDTSSVWTDITPDYRNIHISVARPRDPVAPLWTRITIFPVVNWLPQLHDLEFGRPVGTPTGIAPGTYKVKIFGVKAPTIVGRYFFKIFAAPDSGGLGNRDFASIGARNFPTVVVAAGVQPNFLTGVLLNAFTGGPLSAPAKIVASGVTRGGQQVQGQAYINATANGAYTIYGLPDGTYTLTALAAGFASSSAVSVNVATGGSGVSGPSINMFPGGNITLTITSKESSTGTVIPWGVSRPLWAEVLSPGGAVVDVLNAGNVSATATTLAFSFNAVTLDGHIPQDLADRLNGLGGQNFLISIHIDNYVEQGPVAVSIPFGGGLGGGQVSSMIEVFRSGSFNINLRFKRFPSDLVAFQTPNPRFAIVEAIDQTARVRGWTLTFIPAGTSSITVPIIGLEGFYPKFRDVDYLDYGLPAGTYTFKVSMTDFLQATSPSAPISGVSTASLSIDMALGAIVSVNVVSRTATSFTPLANWQIPGAPITLSLIPPGGGLAGFARGSQPASGSTAVITLGGVNYFDLTGGTTFYRLGRHDTTLQAGDYNARIETPGYVQNREVPVSLASGSTSAISVDVLIGSFISLTASFTTEGLLAPGGAARFRVEAFDGSGKLVGASAGTIAPASGGLSALVVGFNLYAGDPSVRYANFFDTTDGAFQIDKGVLPGTYTLKLTVPTFLVGQTTVQTTEASTASASILLSKLGRVHGRVFGLRPLFGTTNLVPLSWANVNPGGGAGVLTFSTDGDYEIWLPPGTYSVTYSHPDYAPLTKSITVGPGSDIGMDATLLVPAIAPPANTTSATTQPATTSSITSVTTSSTPTATRTAAATRITTVASTGIDALTVVALVVVLAVAAVAIAVAGRRLFR